MLGIVVCMIDVGSVLLVVVCIWKDYEFLYFVYVVMELFSCMVDVGFVNCVCGIKIWGGLLL